MTVTKAKPAGFFGRSLSNEQDIVAFMQSIATQPPVGHEQQMDKLAEALGMDPVELRG